MKERIWSVYTEIIQVYSHIPGVLVQKLVYDLMFWLNSLPAEDGVSDILSPHAMITGQSIKFTKHFLLNFGEYVHTHEDKDNSLDSLTLEALDIRPTGNIQGGYYFLNLHTSCVITRFTWTALLPHTRICKLVRRTK